MTRLRPVIMTALAMIIGMLPMSLGLGEGGEQNAPLGRAVIGGLLLATFTTLFFVPVMYSVLRRLRRKAPRHEHVNRRPRLRAASSRRRARAPACVAVFAIVVAGAFVVGYTQHHKARGATPTTSDAAGSVRVEVITAKTLSSDRALSLPGVVKPLEETKIYPRASRATSASGTSTSATRSRTASCSPRSTRRSSTRSSHRRAPSSPRRRHR